MITELLTETVKLLFIMNVTAAMSLQLNLTRIIGSDVVYAYHALVDQSTEQLVRLKYSTVLIMTMSDTKNR
jgi:hypothetical protein